MTSNAKEPNRRTRITRGLYLRRHDGANRHAAVFSCFILLAGIANSQSAGNFGSKPAPSMAASATKKDATAPGKGPVVPSILPSRFVGEAEFDSYISTLSAQLSMKSRATDPFGQQQDPNAKPVIKSSLAKNTKRQVQVQSTPFPDIIKQLSVNTIMPREKKFLIGPRTYKQGGTLSIIHRGKTILAQIIDVTARQIDFRNSETGETATLKIEALPVGMTPGTQGIIAPGMSPDALDAPINLDVGNP